MAVAGALLAGMSLTSCEDYLDKEPASDVSADLAFKNFRNAQGFVEEIYNCIPNMTQCGWCPGFNYGDDLIQNPQADGHINHQIDLGNFWAWATVSEFWFSNTAADPTSSDGHSHHFYGHAWYCIAKCNKGIAELENPDHVFNGTEEEKNLLLGQLYFFRGWWHFGMMEFFGGIPYIDEVLDPGAAPTNVRLSYQECAEKAAADFRKAADLLPVNWDSTDTGKASGDNSLRINKVTALSYLGKNYLWAASPLMQYGAQKGGQHTYDYDKELASKAADALGEVLELVRTGACQYKLNDFNYKDIAAHEKADGVDYSYSELWLTSGRGGIQPGGPEAIMRGPSKGWSYTYYRWGMTFVANEVSDGCDNIGHSPTANYVKNYGMANGLPLDDPESGWDKERPYKDRDPRFYHDIVYDGMQYIKATPQMAHSHFKYARLASASQFITPSGENKSMRKAENASRTGYLLNKFVSHIANQYDGGSYMNGGALPHSYCPYMRLADVYLMYAEATAAIGDRSGKSSKCGYTSVDAINVLRDRVGVGHVADKFTGKAYMDEVRRERAVELAFEGFRFHDLQRWLLLTEPAYASKTSQEFLRVDGADEVNMDAVEVTENDKTITLYGTSAEVNFYNIDADGDGVPDNDPRDARVSEFHEEVIITRNYDTKHYWFPLLRDDVYKVDGFEQNPGW